MDLIAMHSTCIYYVDTHTNMFRHDYTDYKAQSQFTRSPTTWLYPSVLGDST